MRNTRHISIGKRKGKERMHIITGNRFRKRVKCGILATMGILLTLGLTKPVEAAVTADDLAGPVQKKETHTEKVISNPTDEDRQMYHQTDYNYVYFGTYPQREIKGAELTAEIRNATYDANGDAVVKGRKYRRISYDQVRLVVPNGLEEFYNKKWHSECVNNYRYFIYEPILWRILESKGNTLILQASCAIDCQPFACEQSQMLGFWETCDLRKWLNYNGEEFHEDDIYKKCHAKAYGAGAGFYCYAFSPEEQKKIKTRNLVQDKCIGYGVHGGNDTEDKVFVLSYNELNNIDYGYCKNITCIQRGVFYSDYAFALEGDTSDKKKNAAKCWVRTPGKTVGRPMYGNIQVEAMMDATTSMGICPATTVSYDLSDCFKVSFYTGTNEQIEPQVMLTSSAAKEPATPLKSGYTFVGWYTDKECTKSYDFVTKLSKDTTLYAGWKDPNSTTSGGKTDVVTPQEMETAEKITTFNAGKASYKILSKDTNTVSYKLKSGKKKSLKSVTIPDTVKYKGITYKVVSIEAKAFKDCKKLTKVTIGKYVTSIGKQAFAGCKKLKTITVKTKKLTKNTIGKNAFKGIDKRATFKLPKSLKGKKYTTYKKVFSQKKIGYKKTMKIKKG
ncbi:MAG: hypothetical protein E7264_06655 [Lachnospiraceae bacterium]|nr:hypothetical protein [Lachnospiraceae bacterium]